MSVFIFMLFLQWQNELKIRYSSQKKIKIRYFLFKIQNKDKIECGFNVQTLATKHQY